MALLHICWSLECQVLLWMISGNFHQLSVSKFVQHSKLPGKNVPKLGFLSVKIMEISSGVKHRRKFILQHCMNAALWRKKSWTDTEWLAWGLAIPPGVITGAKRPIPSLIKRPGKCNLGIVPRSKTIPSSSFPPVSEIIRAIISVIGLPHTLEQVKKTFTQWNLSSVPSSPYRHRVAPNNIMVDNGTVKDPPPVADGPLPKKHCLIIICEEYISQLCQKHVLWHLAKYTPHGVFSLRQDSY